MSRLKNERIRWERMIGRLCNRMRAVYPVGRRVKDIDGGRTHKPKGQR